MQLKVTLKGKINCFQDKDLLNECKKSQITLKMLDGDVETKTVNAKGNNLTYIYTYIYIYIFFFFISEKFTNIFLLI